MKTIETNFDYEKWVEVQSLIKNVNEHNAKFASTNASEAENLLASLIVCIENAPAVDVVEVKHGFWINISNDDKWGACSNCVRAVDMRQSRLKYEYCPYCGSRMDLESEMDNLMPSATSKGWELYQELLADLSRECDEMVKNGELSEEDAAFRYDMVKDEILESLPDELFATSSQKDT